MQITHVRLFFSSYILTDLMGFHRSTTMPAIIPDNKHTPKPTDKMSDLVRYLSSDDEQTQRSAAYYLSQLTTDFDSQRSEALNEGALTPLVAIINSNNVEAYEPAVVTIRNITVPTEAMSIAIDINALPPLVKLLSWSDIAVLQCSCQAITNICWTKGEARKIALDAGVIPLLVGLLGHDNVRVQDAAAYAVWQVTLLEAASAAAYEANIVPILIDLLASVKLKRSVSCALCSVTNGENARLAKVAALNMKGIPALVFSNLVTPNSTNRVPQPCEI
jgi:Armadillo/beta-catenin-like repeat